MNWIKNEQGLINKEGTGIDSGETWSCNIGNLGYRVKDTVLIFFKGLLYWSELYLPLNIKHSI